METFRKNQESTVGLEAIHFLESLKEINSRDKANIIAVASGVKPATLFQTDFVDEAESLSLRTKIKSMCENFGLVFSEGWEHDPEIIGIVSYHYRIARDVEALQRVNEAFKQGLNTHDYHEMLGKSLGMPESAVEAYSRNDNLSLEEQKKFLTREERAFKFFGLSREKFEQEKGIIQAIAKKTQELSPKLYEEILNSVKD